MRRPRRSQRQRLGRRRYQKEHKQRYLGSPYGTTISASDARASTERRVVPSWKWTEWRVRPSRALNPSAPVRQSHQLLSIYLSNLLYSLQSAIVIVKVAIQQRKEVPTLKSHLYHFTWYPSTWKLGPFLCATSAGSQSDSSMQTEKKKKCYRIEIQQRERDGTQRSQSVGLRRENKRERVLWNRYHGCCHVRRCSQGERERESMCGGNDDEDGAIYVISAV